MTNELLFLCPAWCSWCCLDGCSIAEGVSEMLVSIYTVEGLLK